MDKIKEIADKADMIVNGYAFTRENDQIRILNLNNLDKALVISEDGKVLETTMDDIEIRIVHASDRKLTEEGSAKFFVKDDGNTVLQKRGILNDREISKIQEYIKRHYKEMYIKWAEYSRNGFYKGN